jgi:peptidoglycan/xylan/chitin deacetylase (PgdA/CDA1 family)
VRRLGRTLAALLALLLVVGGAGAVTAGKSRAARGPVPRSSTGRAVVLGYHAIASLPEDPLLGRYCVPPARFAEQLDRLARAGWSFVDLDAVLAALRGERALPRRAVLVTFDDAYVDLLKVACPILEERGIPAVAFAVAGQLGGRNEWDCEKGATELALLDAEGLKELAARGVEVGGHTVSHPSLPEVPAGDLGDEVAGCADRLEAAGLPRPRAFSYPYGQWNEEVAAAVAAAGYDVAFTTDRGLVSAGIDPYSVPRLAVHAGDSPLKLYLKVATARWRERLRAWRV